MPTPASQADRSRFDEAVEASPRLRAAWAPTPELGPVVITGQPKAWRETRRAVEQAGGRVAAFHDARLRVPRLVTQGRPVLHGRLLGPFASLPFLFAGQPRKSYFSAAPAPLERCWWHVPLLPRQQEARYRPDLREARGAELGRVYDALADVDSKAQFAALVRGREQGDAGYFRVARYHEYAHPLVRARPGEVAIDAGAYQGDTSMRFAWQMRGRGRVVALEPSPANFARLTRRPIPGLIPLCLGAWHRDDVLAFNEDRGSSRIVRSGTQRIHVAPIDRLVRELDLPRVDVLKFDVEGAEREALEGCRETIARFRPKLQVSIYHRPADLWELPLQLMDQLEGYRFYLGHHSPYSTETDLYALPPA